MFVDILVVPDPPAVLSFDEVMFKEDFKFYKRRCPPPDLSDVLDLQSLCYRVTEVGERPLPGLKPPKQWKIYDIPNKPGLIVIRNPFTALGQRYWVCRCLQDFTCKPQKLNLDAHGDLAPEENWWDVCNTSVKRGPEMCVETGKWYKVEFEHLQQKGHVFKDSYKIDAARGKMLVKKLRWATLGYHHNWDSKIVNGDLIKINQSTVSRIIKRVSIGIAQNLGQFVKFPLTEQQYGNNRNLFYEVAQFPGVTGVIDCTHIPIQSPGGQFAELYRNRKGWMSLNVQLICGPQMEIMDIVSRWPGSTHDSRIFDNSAICQKFIDGRVHGILLGDNGYPQLPYLYTPILDHHVRTPAERRYNRAHKSTRNIIERLNGVWKQRFPCLRRKLLTKAITTQAIIVTCAILHNIGIQRRDYFENVEEDPVEGIPVANANAVQNPRARILRQQFIQRHFN